MIDKILDATHDWLTGRWLGWSWAVVAFTYYVLVIWWITSARTEQPFAYEMFIATLMALPPVLLFYFLAAFRKYLNSEPGDETWNIRMVASFFGLVFVGWIMLSIALG